MKDLFVTGTDTDVGKTFITCALIEAFAARGIRATPMKPVAAGTINVNGVEMNADVAMLREVSATKAALGDVNPYCFSEPIAPHMIVSRRIPISYWSRARGGFWYRFRRANQWPKFPSRWDLT